jgi:ABC-type hemin transport system substrate-binding protein
VVSLVPSLTESLFELGLGESLVGITNYCINPKESVRRLPRIGGTKDARLADILALRPDMVIASQEENSQEMVTHLQEEGIPILVANPRSVSQAIEVLWQLVDLYHSQPAGQRLRTLEMPLDWARTARAGLPEVLYFCPIWQDITTQGQGWWMVFNRHTYASDLLGLFGGVNIFANRSRRYPLEADLGKAQAEPAGERDTRYPRVTLEEVLAAQPELILLPSEPYSFSEADLNRFLELFSKTPAARHGKVFQVDGSLITWYGTRLGRALNELPAFFS